MNKDKIVKMLLIIAAIIIFCSIFVRLFSGSETLTEYAAKNPDIAHRENVTVPRETGASNGQLKEPEHAKDNNIVKKDDMDNDMDNPISNNSMNADKIKNEEPESEDSDMIQNSDRVIYKDGFYYEPLSEEMKKRITGISYPVTEAAKESTVIEAINIVNSAEDIQVSYDELCYMNVLHYNFHGIERMGELICNKAIAQDLVEIFYELYQNEYQIEQIRLIDEYSGDDMLSMQDNNTSCFNYRVVDGTSNLSKHAMGLAIDINPFFNPYVVFQSDGATYISPQGSETYADRSQNFAYKIDENDLCYKLFMEHGFIWGGNWNSCKDYQHFQKTPE